MNKFVKKVWAAALPAVCLSFAVADVDAQGMPQLERCRTENQGAPSDMSRALDHMRVSNQTRDRAIKEERREQEQRAREQDPRVVESRQLAQQFGATLKSALERAISERGPAAAIEVCRDEAPRIAAQLSVEHGVKVARTALKVRNAGNTPQSWQAAELMTFQQRLETGADAATLEYFEPRPDGGARYLKAIITAPLCTVCHGESIAPDVQAALKRHYPADQATGFKVPDLRGAFSIEWPAVSGAQTR